MHLPWLWNAKRQMIDESDENQSKTDKYFMDAIFRIECQAQKLENCRQ